jgi:PAS domain S-box-containing protein
MTIAGDAGQTSRAGGPVDTDRVNYRVLFDSGPRPAWVYALEDGRILEVNAAACRRYGYTRDELLALRVDEVAREPEAPTQYDEMLVRGFRHGTAVLTRKDGTTVDFLYRASKTQLAGMNFFVSVGFVAED